MLQTSGYPLLFAEHKYQESTALPDLSGLHLKIEEKDAFGHKLERATCAALRMEEKHMLDRHVWVSIRIDGQILHHRKYPMTKSLQTAGNGS